MGSLAAFFTSYAHRDAKDVKRLRDVLEPLLKSSPKFHFGEWIDHQILPGDPWHVEIKQALARVHFGLVLVSPSLLASDYTIKHELPVLLSKPMVVPVALHRVLFDGSMDLKELEGRQIFHDSKGRAFEACRTAADRRDFARDLFQAILALLEKHPC